MTPDWEPCSVGMAEYKRVVELLRVAEERLKAAHYELALRPSNPSAVFVGFLQDQVEGLKSSLAAAKERAEKANADCHDIGQDYARDTGTYLDQIAALTADIARLRAALEDVRVVAAVSCDDDMLMLLRQCLQIAKAALSAPGADGGKAPRV